MNLRKIMMLGLGPIFAAALLVSTQTQALPNNTAAAGDSITMGFAADCRYNRWFWDLFCLLGGDQPEHSWFDGWDSDVNSVHDKYKQIDSSISANKNAAASGSEMRGGNNNFATQAANIVAQSNTPDHVEVILGGNDICNRDCTDPNNCSNPVYSESQWRSSVRAGLNTLVSGLASGSTVYLGGVPRVQDLRAAGLAKQATSSRIRCENVWSSFNICNIATSGSSMNGESSAQRLAAIEGIQQRYNEIIAEEAASYNGTNGVEVVASYQGENASTVGTFSFGKDDIDGGDCFHPSRRGQGIAANLMWNSNPDK